MKVACAALALLAASAQALTLKDYAAAAGKYVGNIGDTHYMQSDPTYLQVLKDEFTHFTAENQMKWMYTHPEPHVYNFTGSDYAVKTAQSLGLKIRGHTLVWESQLPSWVSGGNWTKEELTAVMVDHIKTVMYRYKGQITHWDVLNEPFNDDGSLKRTVFYNVIGPEYVDIAFKTAHEVDPDALLFVNDFAMERVNAKTTAVLEFVKAARARGVPIHGVGSEAHGRTEMTKQDLMESMQRYSDAGIYTAITELDIRIILPVDAAKIETQKLKYYETVLACVKVPKCLGVTMWGINDKYSWINTEFPGQGSPLLWDDNYNKKPAYEGFVYALEGRNYDGTFPPAPSPSPSPVAVSTTTTATLTKKTKKPKPTPPGKGKPGKPGNH